MILRVYTQPEHENFAPHISGGVLTLATCMPAVREHAKKGEWIAGLTTVKMGIRLSFLAQVSYTMPRDAYWAVYGDSRLDSIYKPDPYSPNGFRQLPNAWHGPSRVDYDMQSNRVLVSRNFFNFSRGYYYDWDEPSGLALASEFSFILRKGVRGAGALLEVYNSFLDWVSLEREEELQTLSDPELIMP